MAVNTETTITDRLLSGSDFNVFYDFQATKGAVNSNPDWTAFRRGEGIPTTVKSFTEGANIPTDRQAVKQIEESDEYMAELSGGTTKQNIAMLVASLAGGNEVQRTDTGTGYAATASGFTDTGGEFVNYNVGDVIFFDGFANTELNRGYMITAKADSNTISTSPTPAATETAGASVTASCNVTYSGEAETLMMMQQRAPDNTKVGNTDYQTYYDGYIDTFGLEIPDTGVVTSSMSVKFGEKVAGSAAISGQTDNAQMTDPELSAVSNIKAFYVGNTKQNCLVKSMSVELANNYQADDGAGCDKQYSIGQLAVTGTVVVRSPISAPFVWRDYYRNATDIGSLAVEMSHDSSDTDQTFIVIDNVKVTEHSQPTGSNTTANSEASYTAQRNDTLGTTIRVYRNWV